MITEAAFIDTNTTNKSTTMVATDQNSDFTNCENKSETLNVVTNGNFSFRSSNSKINNEIENNEFDFDNANSTNEPSNGEDVIDYGRPKKLQKGLNQGLISNNLMNQQQQTNNSTFGQLDSEFNLNRTNKQFLKSNNLPFIDNDHSSNQQQSTSRRKHNQSDNEFENDNFECSVTNKDNTLGDNNSSPKVPPLRIVISSSTTGRNSKDLNQNSNTNNYVVSCVDSQINDKKESNNDNFYLTRSSAQSSSSSINSTNPTSTNVTSGRITRSQRAAALNHLTSDDSQSRYSHSPDEFSNDFNSEEQLPQTQTIYLNSQKEKESNKENKDLRRRKGRGKGGLQSLNTQSNSSSTSSTTSTNNNLNNGSINQQSLDASMQLDDQSQLDQSMINLSSVSRDYQMPAYNCYISFQNIRKQVEKRRQTMCDSNLKSSQKAPQGFKNYLLTTGNYLLENRNKSMRNVNPNLKIEQINVPELLDNLTNTDQLIELYKEQELEREKLKVQHLVEKEKVKLSIEQEILRVHNRAALAMANQSLPFSFTVLMKDEEIYNPIDQDQDHSFDRNNLDSTANQKDGNNSSNSQTKNEYSRATYSCPSNNTYADLFTLTGKSEDIGSRCRYSGRLLHSWLQDVEDKWIKIKKEILNRQKREAESLQAIQKLNWEWKLKEISKKLKISLEEDKSADKFNEKQWYDNLQMNEDQLIPCIRVNEEFDFS